MSFAALRNRRDGCLFLSFMNPEMFSCFESGRISNFSDQGSVSFIIFHWMFLELTVCLYKRNSKSLCSFSKMWFTSLLIHHKNLQKSLLQQPQEMTQIFGDSYYTMVCIRYSARNYRPSFRENKPNTLVLYDWKRAFWACFRENWVYKFVHRTLRSESRLHLTGCFWQKNKTYRTYEEIYWKRGPCFVVGDCLLPPPPAITVGSVHLPYLSLLVFFLCVAGGACS